MKKYYAIATPFLLDKITPDILRRGILLNGKEVLIVFERKKDAIEAAKDIPEKGSKKACIIYEIEFKGEKGRTDTTFELKNGTKIERVFSVVPSQTAEFKVINASLPHIEGHKFTKPFDLSNTGKKTSSKKASAKVSKEDEVVTLPQKVVVVGGLIAVTIILNFMVGPVVMGIAFGLGIAIYFDPDKIADYFKSLYSSLLTNAKQSHKYQLKAEKDISVLEKELDPHNETYKRLIKRFNKLLTEVSEYESTKEENEVQRQLSKFGKLVVLQLKRKALEKIVKIEIPSARNDAMQNVLDGVNMEKVIKKVKKFKF